MPLTIEQAGYPDIHLTAHYSVRPLQDRSYYAYRFEWWRNKKGWVIEELHHKIYLENTPAEVEKFEATHGYNLVTVSRGWREGNNIFLLGGGVVVTYPHSVVRGQEWPQDSGYRLSGVTVQGAAARRFEFGRHFFLSVEGKVTASWARIPVVSGHATTPDAAFHALGGVGIQTRRP
jgi:hypothetical protein